jgi:hypothetical protein
MVNNRLGVGVKLKNWFLYILLRRGGEAEYGDITSRETCIILYGILRTEQHRPVRIVSSKKAIKKQIKNIITAITHKQQQQQRLT